MERFWNIVHYFVYKLDYKLHLSFNKINPVYYFYKLPFAKRHFEKKGIDPLVEANKAFKRPDVGISSIRAGGFMYILIFLLCLGVANFVTGIAQQGLTLKLYLFIIFVVISILTNHVLLFRNDKYLTYFKELDVMPKKLKKKWAWISFLVILGILSFVVGSFAFAMYQM
jgi:hypothetical protein